MRSSLVHVFAILGIAASIVLASCSLHGENPPSGSGSAVSSSATASQSLAYYQQVWRDTFRAYQSGVVTPPARGSYDFALTAFVNGDAEKIRKIVPLIAGNFSDVSFHVAGEYDFSDSAHPTLSGTAQMYLDKRDFGMGDLDIGFDVAPTGDVSYELRNVSTGALDALRISADSQKSLLAIFAAHPGERLGNTGSTRMGPSASGMVSAILTTLRESDKHSPLYRDSHAQEAKIISAFLDNEVIEVYSGATTDHDTLQFRFRTDNMVKFLNAVAGILGGDNAHKDFSNDSTLFRDILLSGTLDILEHRILHSEFTLEVPLRGGTLQKGFSFDVLRIHSLLRVPDPNALNVDLTTNISAQSAPDNQLQIRLQ